MSKTDQHYEDTYLYGDDEEQIARDYLRIMSGCIWMVLGVIGILIIAIVVMLITALRG